MDSSGATSITVENVSWYSECNKDENGKKNVVVCNIRSSLKAM